MATKSFTDLLKDAPKNWGCWDAEDEIGALYFLTRGSRRRRFAGESDCH